MTSDLLQLDWPLGVPVISDGEVTLRAHTPDDVDAVWEMATDPRMAAFTTVPQPYGREQAEQYVHEIIPAHWKQTKREWAIEAADDTGRVRFAGNVAVLGAPHGEISFALHPWARGRGIMQRAAAQLIDWAFAEGGVELITWRALVGNLGSLRVAHALGFSLDAKLPAAALHRQEPRDMWVGHLKFGDHPIPRARWLDTVIESAELRLRPPRLSDVPAIVEASNDPLTVRWLGATMPQPYTERDGAAFVHDAWWEAARADTLSWTIADPQTDDLLGSLQLSGLHDSSSNDAADVGYWMHPRARRLGVMSTAVGLAVDHALSPDGLDRRRVSLNAAAGNLPSNLIALANGFTRYGVRPSAERLGDDSWDDLFCYEFVRPGD